MSCGVGHRRGLGLALWLWCRLVATAPIRPLSWEPPYAASVALKRQKTTKKAIPPPPSEIKTAKLVLHSVSAILVRMNCVCTYELQNTTCVIWGILQKR